MAAAMKRGETPFENLVLFVLLLVFVASKKKKTRKIVFFCYGKKTEFVLSSVKCSTAVKFKKNQIPTLNLKKK